MLVLDRCRDGAVRDVIMEPAGVAIPLLLSFLLGLLFGVLATGLLPMYSQTFKRAAAQFEHAGNSLVFFLLVAGFAFGVLATMALSAIL